MNVTCQEKGPVLRVHLYQQIGFLFVFVYLPHPILPPPPDDTHGYNVLILVDIITPSPSPGLRPRLSHRPSQGPACMHGTLDTFLHFF